MMKMNVYQIKKSNVLFIIGIVLGFFLGTKLLNSQDPMCNLVSCGDNLNHGCVVSRDVKNQDTNDEVPIPKGSIIAGVMTAKKYLTTRALASYNTWGQNFPGKILYFSSEDSSEIAPKGLPLVCLKGVGDTYPPQKKSFLMMKYLWEFYGDQYEWFIRADDDVYIRTDKLSNFLNSLNSSKVYYIGQPGYGKEDEEEDLHIGEIDNYCMGGPGMIVSRSIMEKLVPRISYCLQTLMYSTHEDVELGRCIYNTTSTHCTSAYEMGQLFFHNYAEPKGSFTQEVKKSHINLAITLHPVKNNTQQYRLHYYFQSIKSQQLRNQIVQRKLEIENIDKVLNQYDFSGIDYANTLLTKSKFGEMHQRSRDFLASWQSIGSKFALYSPKANNPHQKLPTAFIVAFIDLTTQTKLKIFKKYLGLKGEFDVRLIKTQLRHAYKRVNPYTGADYVLNVKFNWKRNRRTRTSYKHMHLYLHQPFAPIEFREEICHSSLSDRYVPSQEELPLPRFMAEEITFKSARCSEVIHFIVALSGRVNTFLRFMTNFENVVLKTETEVVLVVMAYDDQSNSRNQIRTYTDNLSSKYPQHELKVIDMEGDFARGKALELGAKHFHNDSLLAFIDVDLNITRDALFRFRKNTIQGRQAYFPIFFSQFDPSISCDAQCHKSQQIFHNQLGYWRQSSYGQVVVYNSDFLAVGGFDKSIEGWGKEDLILFDAFVRKNYTLFRAPEPGFIHIYHPIICDENLEKSQLTMCLGTKANTYASREVLASILDQNKLL